MNRWELYFLYLAVLVFMAAVVMLVVEKKTDGFKKKRSFKVYVQAHILMIFNFMKNESFDYQEVSSFETSSKESVALPEFLKRFENAFKHHKDAVKPNEILSLLLNLQSLLLFSFRLRSIIQEIDTKALKKLSLEHGTHLSKKELTLLFELIVALDRFVSDLAHHDRFGKIKSIKRRMQAGVWVGIDVDKDCLNTDNCLHDDMQWMIENEASIAEIAHNLRILSQQVSLYLGKDTLELVL